MRIPNDAWVPRVLVEDSTDVGGVRSAGQCEARQRRRDSGGVRSQREVYAAPSNLKPDNVLLTLDGNCRLADMGAARGVSDDGTIRGGEQATASAPRTAKAVDLSKGRRMSITGTHGYRAPEVYERNYGKPADWWNVVLNHRDAHGE